MELSLAILFMVYYSCLIIWLGSESGSQSIAVKLDESLQLDDAVLNSYVNGGPWFDFAGGESQHETILGWYLLPNSNSPPLPAIVESKIGQGIALLCGPHIEFDPNLMAASSMEESISDRVHVLSLLPSLLSGNKLRLRLMIRLFTRLGLVVNKPDQQSNEKMELSPMILCSAPESQSSIPIILNALKSKLSDLLEKDMQIFILSDCVNDFAFIKQEFTLGEDSSRLESRLPQGSSISDKSVLIYYSLSPTSHSPLPVSFELERYFSLMPPNSTFGSTVLYGEKMASTQTLFEKNYSFQSALPDGTVCITSNQLSGRGMSLQV